MASEPNWKKFEKVIKIIQEQLTPDANVIHDYKIPNRKGKKRQIDVYIEHKAGFITYKTIIECKDYKRPITRDQLEGFPIKMKDVGAHAGIVISKSGFSDGVKDLATEYNFKIMTYREAEQADWEDIFKDEAWLHITTPSEIQVTHCKLQLASQETLQILPTANLINSQQQIIGRLDELINNRILSNLTRNINLMNLVEFEFELVLLEDDILAQVQRTQNYVRILRILLMIEVIHKVYMVNLKLADGQIVKDELLNETEFIQLTSAGFNLREIFAQQEGRMLSKKELLEIRNSSHKIFRLHPSQISAKIEAMITVIPD